jgi:hypothetical protein
MLHLLPIRLILWLFVAAAALSVVAFAYAGWFSEGTFATLSLVVRGVGTLVPAGILLLFAGWRWIPWLRSTIFPYLGGCWSGDIAFDENGVQQTRAATLEISHRLTGIVMILETAESISRTLVVHAEKNRHFERYRLYYAFLNERKEGTAGAGHRYRGLAILRVETGRPLRMAGDYFTDTHRRGTLTLEQAAPNPWWKLWR